MNALAPWPTVLRGAIAAAALVLVACGGEDGPSPPPGTKIVPLAVTTPRIGNAMGCARRLSDDAWGCWGLDVYRRFGLGPEGAADTSPVTDRPFTVLPAPVPFTDIVLGGYGTCALDATGQAWCWGDNYVGMTGTGSTDAVVDHPMPVQGGLRFRMLFAPGMFGTGNTCGVTVAGEAYCWGMNNSYAILGTGDTQSRTAPTRVPGLPPLQSMAVGYSSSCGLAEDGTAWCWGDNSDRQIADTSADLLPRPTPSGAPHRYRAIAVSYWATCGVSVEGPTYCWGFNHGGGLGPHAPNAPTAVPQLVVRDTLFVELVSDASDQFFGRTAEGRVFRWGDSGGDNFLATPTELIAGAQLQTLDAGSLTTHLWGVGACGLAADNALVCAVPMIRRAAVLTDSGLVVTSERGTVPYPEHED